MQMQDQRLGAEQEQDQLPQEPLLATVMETCMVQACHMPGQPLHSHLLGLLGGWVTPRSAEEMLDVQHQRVDIPACKGLLQKRPEDNLC